MCVCACVLQVTSVFDRNKDGKIDVEDAKVAFDDIMQVVGFNMLGSRSLSTRTFSNTFPYHHDLLLGSTDGSSL